MGDPENTAGLRFFDIKNLSVREWHSLPGGQGKPEQVHLMLEVEGIPHPLIVRFKSRRPVDELIVALMSHADNVWGKTKK